MESAPEPTSKCEVCGRPLHRFYELPAREYSYLLGQYLGDGVVAYIHRGVYSLRIVCDKHGPGRKHERKIELTEWQQAIVDREPQQLIRGLIQSDGCRVMNRVVVDGKEYAYPRSFFAQVSKDIQGIFCRALEEVGIEYSFSTRGRDVTIARRESVARLDSFVGKKS